MPAAVGSAGASDAPAPAVARPAGAAPLTATGTKTVKGTPVVQRVKIDKVTAQTISADHTMVSAIVTDADKPALRDPVLISVDVNVPFGDLSRSSSPVIVLNGQTLGDSVVPFKERNRVVAIVRDGTRLDKDIRVQVGWLGDFDRTLSEPVQAQLTR
jgi:hypothetical protein